jgi:hypothetical protein
MSQFLPSIDRHFVENRGQVANDDVRFYAQGNPLSVGLAKYGVVFTYKPGQTGANRETGPEAARSTSFTLLFEGCDQVDPGGNTPMEHTSNFFLGDDPDRWVRGAASFAEVVYEGLYDGVDLRFYFRDGMFKYDFQLDAGVDPAVVSLRYEGVDGLSVDPVTGELLIATGRGTLRDMAPVIFQEGAVGAGEFPGSFLLGADESVRFAVPDECRQELPMTIDPGLAFSTFLGGNDEDYLQDMEVDDEGCMYLVGKTDSSNFPTRTGSYDTGYNGYFDAFVIKMADDGASMKYATFLGGSGYDYGESICIDSAGCAYVTGFTAGGFPLTSGAYDTTYSGGEAFVTKLSADGSDVEFSTYLGGTAGEWGYAICLDEDDNVYVQGETLSNDLPCTSGCYDDYYDGNRDAFLAKLDSTGSSLLYMTYLGGREREYPTEVWAQGSSDVFLVGHTSSSDFPTTTGAFRTTHRGAADVYVTKLNITKTTLEYSTFVGASGVDNGLDLHVDDAGCAYVVGITDSVSFPNTDGAYQKGRAGWYDAFLFKLNPAGSAMVFCTFLGHTRWDAANGVHVNDDGTVWVVGNTDSAQFPTTQGAYCSTLEGMSDAFLSKFSADGSKLLYSTLLGGSDYDRAQKVAFVNGCLCVSGYTYSSDMPLTTGALDSTLGGRYDSFALKMDFEPPDVRGDTVRPQATTGDPYHIRVNATDNIAVTGVEMEYWQGAGPRVRTNMALETGTGKNGTWRVTVTPSASSLEDIVFWFRMWDAAGNEVTTDPMGVTVVDNDPPTVEDLTTSPAIMGATHDIRVTVKDNIGVDQVRVVQWFGDLSGDATNVTMTPETVTGGGNGTYVHEVQVPQVLDRWLNFQVFTTDTSGNWYLTLARRIDLHDDLGPWFGDDRTPDVATTGDPLTFSVDVHDNVAIGLVEVEYGYGEAPPRTVPMVEGTSPEWSLTLMVDHTRDDLHYRFIANDTFGNQNTTLEGTVTIVDNDPPELVEDLTPGSTTTGGTLVTEVVAIDNLGQMTAGVGWRLGEGTAKWDEMVGSLDGTTGRWTFTHTIDVPTDSVEPITYMLELRDPTGNLNATGEWSATVVDDDRPTFGSDASEDVAVKGQMFHLDIEVGDNIGVNQLWCERWYGEGEITNSSMLMDTRLAFDLPRDPEGPLRYRFSARDEEGNWNSTETFERVPVNIAPRITGPDVWNVTEEEQADMDLRGSITDTNDHIDDLVVSCSHPNITVDGMALFTFHDTWVPEYVIELSITDGEDTTWHNVTVRVINVNDAPVITQVVKGEALIEPSKITRVLKGHNITAEATDEDGDDLVFMWYADERVLATGPYLLYGDLPRGRPSVVTLEVYDGTDKATYTFEVVSVVEEESRPIWPYALVILLIVGVIGSVIWSRFFRGGPG